MVRRDAAWRVNAGEERVGMTRVVRSGWWEWHGRHGKTRPGLVRSVMARRGRQRRRGCESCGLAGLDEVCSGRHGGRVRSGEFGRGKVTQERNEMEGSGTVRRGRQARNGEYRKDEARHGLVRIGKAR